MGLLRIVCVDIGTSSVKAELVDAVALGTEIPAGTPAIGKRTLTVVTSVEHSIHTDHPAEGQVIQDAQEWFTATKACIAELQAVATAAEGDRVSTTAPALSGSQPVPDAQSWCDAISLTGQMQDLVLLDAHHRPTAPVILYSDVRAKPELDALLTDLPWADWYDRLPNIPDADCIPAKLRYLDKHGHGAEPDNNVAPESNVTAGNESAGIEHEYERSQAMLFSAAGAAAAALTDQYACDRLTASTTSLYDPTTGDWFDIDHFIRHHRPPQLPRIVEPGIVGRVTEQSAPEWNLPTGTPVVMGLGDAGATSDGTLATLGGSSTTGDNAYLYLGTTGWVAHLDQAPLTPEKREGFFRLAHPHGTLNIASLANAGSALRWGRATLLGCDGRRGPDPESPEALQTAEVELTRALHRQAWQDVAVNPALGGERLAALGSSGTRGAFSNVQYRHEACDLYAGLVAGLAQNVAVLLDALGVEQTSSPLPVTGGVLRSPGVRRILAQVLGRDLELIDVENATLRHCALVAVEALAGR